MQSPKVAMTHPIFIGSEIFRGSSYGPWHPLRVPRVSTVMDLARALGWLARDQYRTSPRAQPSALTAFHTADYVAAVVQAEASQSVTADVRARHNLGTPANPVFPEMFRRPATGVGGSLLAAELLASGGVVFNPGGGTHHGFPDYANGFCFFNDPVLAILSLQRQGAGRVAYVDIDAHHADGVAAAFAATPDVLVVSVHEEDRWPRTGALEDRGAGNLVNLPLPKGTDDAGFAMALDRVILPFVARHRPDAIVLQCGADAVQEDPQSRLALSNASHRATVAALRPMSTRYLVLGGGGYNPWSVGRCWTGVWATLAGYELPDHLPRSAQSVLAALTWQGRKPASPPDHWITTLADAPRHGPISDDIRTRTAQLAQRLRAEV